MTKAWLHAILVLLQDIAGEMTKVDPALAPVATKISEALSFLETVI